MAAILLTILAPLAASAWIIVTRKKIGYAALTGAAGSLAGSILLFMAALNGAVTQLQFTGLPGMPFRLEATEMAAVLALVVAVITTFILVYAIGYMKEEKGKLRFWSGITLFMGAMQLLVLAGDWILFVIAWEVMGFASYLLIGTWYWKKEAGDAANKAFIMNRVAELGLYVGVFVIILAGGSSQILAEPVQGVSVVGTLALLLAVMGKSAQVPFQSWLSAAMAGPTPVSALLHSATMVAAGIILLLKAFPLFPPDALFWIGLVGGITILLTGATAIFSEDIKRMLAASTSSQLGFMALAIGAGYPAAALAHLIAHAFMKSSLFLGAGIFQHEMHSTNYEKLKGSGKKLKLAFSGFAVSGLALAGIPPLIGFWSKDAILTAGLQADPASWYFPAVLIGAFFTAIYMGRAFGILWKGHSEPEEKPKKLPWMHLGFLTLVTAVIAGWLFLDPLVETSGFSIPKDNIAMISGLGAAFLGLAAGWFATTPILKNRVWMFFRDNYPVAGGYTNVIVQPFQMLATGANLIEQFLLQSVFEIGKAFLMLARWLANVPDRAVSFVIDQIGAFNLNIGQWTQITDDRGIVEWIAGLVASIQRLGQYGRNIQSGLVHRELALSVYGMILALIILSLTYL
ncbi:NADH-quinone oxidoreductase subunit L [Gracilimonas sediminicola]|uniref:NADH-quinone oxidoreductase subunit 5 family protein n=1 Tax=Gracilimonas sediminicola TaxID=2952158 RepID=UPI0038D48680